MASWSHSFLMFTLVMDALQATSQEHDLTRDIGFQPVRAHLEK
ncbi:hypothetical protein MFUL124B02_26145 [Myxococcus fulvus 124B02]|nr:hypothetical protein MFUL124B02_26145 [Myxococcus fulvus 124B02]